MGISGDNCGGLPFLKMHGLGNDFVILDLRNCADPLNIPLIKAIGHKHLGVGFDQLAAIYTSPEPDIAASVKFWNSDGSLSAACGNATRCIGRLLMQEGGDKNLKIKSDFGVLEIRQTEDGPASVNMGHPKTDWQDIPLTRAVDTLHLPIDGAPTATSMGNPHCSFFVEDVETLDIVEIGSRIETDPLFPERTNVQLVQILDRKNLRVRVWERGVGVTMASGSSSCAVVVSACRLALAEQNVTVHLDGGALQIDWSADGVWMTGETALVFSGVLSHEFMDSVT